MATKHAGLGAALVVLLAVFGLMTLVGVILLMMWFQPDIEHSPAQVESTSILKNPGISPILPVLPHTDVISWSKQLKLLGAITFAVFFLVPQGYCQWKELPSTGSPVERLPDRTIFVGQSGLGPLLVAKLVDKERNAKERKAIIEVEIDGVQLVEPDATHNHPKIDEAHIQYRLDGGPVENSISKTWTFAQLSVGQHEIVVSLVTSDNHLLGRSKKLHVRIP